MKGHPREGAHHLPEGVAPVKGTGILGEMKDDDRGPKVPSDMITWLLKESLM
jgi:hypothetical protein